MAGNAVLLKHASQTMLAGERFQMAMDRAGLPKGLFQNLVLSHDQTGRILGAGLVDHCNFTGSVSGGRSIERAAAGSFTSLGLELGGKDPAYVRAGRQSRPRHREPRRRRLLQFRPVLLRHRAHLRAREALRPLRRGRGRSREHLCARQSARRSDDARPDGAQALRRSGAPAERGSRGEGREGAYRHEALSPRIPGAPPISRRRC